LILLRLPLSPPSAPRPTNLLTRLLLLLVAAQSPMPQLALPLADLLRNMETTSISLPHLQCTLLPCICLTILLL
jgi:hypothetical protein